MLSTGVVAVVVGVAAECASRNEGDAKAAGLKVCRCTCGPEAWRCTGGERISCIANGGDGDQCPETPGTEWLGCGVKVPPLQTAAGAVAIREDDWFARRRLTSSRKL
mmetsp:Transcript_51444/g.62933  ORF Transcript_51444/g.62933 Transcript_51444/m.62933 type:complete len:107 (-) Transcript_51444:156-476(-)